MRRIVYAVVVTILHKLKQSINNCYWSKIVRRISTQKLVTIQYINPTGDKVELRQCEYPAKSTTEINQSFHHKKTTIKKTKICRTQPPPQLTPSPLLPNKKSPHQGKSRGRLSTRELIYDICFFWMHKSIYFCHSIE